MNGASQFSEDFRRLQLQLLSSTVRSLEEIIRLATTEVASLLSHSSASKPTQHFGVVGFILRSEASCAMETSLRVSVAVSFHVMKECLSVYSYGYLLRARCTTTSQDLKAALVQQQLKLTALENSLHEREKALKAFEKALRTRKVDLYKRCGRK